MQIFSLVISCVIFVLGVIGNGLVMYVTGFKMKTTVNSVWLQNLALADFLFTLFLIFYMISLSLNHRWPFGAVMCKLNSLVQISTMFTSVFLLTAISLERCLATWLVHWTRNNCTPKCARIVCLSTWVVSLTCSIPFVEPRTVVENKCVRNKDPLAMKHIAMFRFVIGFLIPFLVITCCYVAIAVRVSRLKIMKKRKVKPFSFILAFILAFFICWLPLHINDLIIIEQEYAFKYNHKHYNQCLYQRARMISPFVVSLAFFNSCVNPLLYTCMCEDFRHKLRLWRNNVTFSEVRPNMDEGEELL
ncbi:C3a anaphylatoxin chemotactic receptor-like isoform X2 [Sardina pilchardus]